MNVSQDLAIVDLILPNGVTGWDVLDAIHALGQVRPRILVLTGARISDAEEAKILQKADAIMVLDHGEIKEIGTHDKLLAHDGYYKKLYEMQFKKVVVL